MPREALPAALVMFAGMGAGPRFVRPQAQAFGGSMLVPPWPRPRHGETVHAYAARWAAELEPQLPPGRTVALAGVSFGGMIALEMATLFRARPACVLLIASGRSGAAVAPSWRLLERLASPVPWRWASPAAPALGWLHGLHMGLGPARRRLLAAVARDLDLSLTQWCARAVTHWPGLPRERALQLPPVSHLHGGDDPMMPPALAQPPPDDLISGGRHLIHLSHADRVNAWVRERLARCVRPAEPGENPYAVMGPALQ